MIGKLLPAVLALGLVGAGAAAQDRPAAQRFTLVIVVTASGGIAQFDYPSARACESAIAAIRGQFDQTARALPGGGAIYSAPPMLFCVPR